MRRIETLQGVTIRDRAMKEIADGIVSAARIAAYRSVANTVNPREFPLPRTSASFEQIFSALFRSLPDARQKSVRARVMERLNRETIAGLQPELRLSSTDLRSAKPAEELLMSRVPAGRLSLPDIDIRRARMTVSGVQVNASVPGTMRLSGTPVLPKPGRISNPKYIIQKKYNELGGAKGFLGAATSNYGFTPDGAGVFRHFRGGSIYWTRQTGAHEVHGAIRRKWKEIGWEQSSLGYPLTDETRNSDGVGRFNHFENGSIYWTHKTGAHEVHGAIREKWESLGGERSFLRYPVTDELGTPDGAGRFNHFQGGSIYWTQKTGAHEVHGAIREFWKKYGWERGYLGYPLTDEHDTPDGKGRRSVFQGGSVTWYPRRGAYATSTEPISKLHCRLLRLHCVDETGTPSLGGELGSDDMRLGGTVIDTYGTVRRFDNINLGQYNDDTWSDWPPAVVHTFDVNQTDGVWPKGFVVTMVLVEKDHGGYSDFMDKVMTKAQSIANDELAKIAAGVGAYVGGGPLGAFVGYFAGLIAAKVVEEVFDLVREIFEDDIFMPLTMHVQLPGPGALFDDGSYESADGHWWVTGHHGKYEFWVDFVVS